MKRVRLLSLAVLALTIAVLCLRYAPFCLRYVPQWLPIHPPHLSRPDGMAPPAFEAYTRACVRAKIHPWRVGQTIGDHPLSLGYHKKDGAFRWRGAAYEYCAAVDLGVGGLDDVQINHFLEELAQQGFAAFYRHEGKWRGDEHIHAIYALLPMKIQLRRQVREFLQEHRKKRKSPLKWESHWQRIAGTRFAVSTKERTKSLKRTSALR